MANPGADDVNVEADDVTSALRQAQLEALAGGLARFAPTHIAVELPPARATDLDEWYRAYRRSGSVALPPSELDQIAFRLAARLGHARVYGVDHAGDFDVGALAAYARDHGQAEQVALARDITGRAAAEIERIQRTGTVADVLRYLNEPAFDEVHGFYLALAPIGRDTTYPGAAEVSGWYERNLTIFTNIWRLARQPRARILVVIGAGHGTLLRRFVQDSPELELVSALEYLP